MFNSLKKYGKIVFLFMIVFISSFLVVDKVEAATALKKGNCVINTTGEYYLSESYNCNYFYINADVITKGLINGFSFSNWPISISESKSELSYNNFAEICDGECCS